MRKFPPGCSGEPDSLQVSSQIRKNTWPRKGLLFTGTQTENVGEKSLNDIETQPNEKPLARFALSVGPAVIIFFQRQKISPESRDQKQGIHQ